MISQVELEFRSTGTGRTQNERLRDYLEAHPRRWLPMPELACVISETGIGVAVHSRVNDCRKKFEMNIAHRRAKSDDGRYHSEYCFNP